MMVANFSLRIGEEIPMQRPGEAVTGIDLDRRAAGQVARKGPVAAGRLQHPPAFRRRASMRRTTASGVNTWPRRAIS